MDQAFIQSCFQPVVMVSASPSVQRLLEKDNLTFQQLLRPFGAELHKNLSLQSASLLRSAHCLRVHVSLVATIQCVLPAGSGVVLCATQCIRSTHVAPSNLRSRLALKAISISPFPRIFSTEFDLWPLSILCTSINAPRTLFSTPNPHPHPPTHVSFLSPFCTTLLSVSSPAPQSGLASTIKISVHSSLVHSTSTSFSLTDLAFRSAERSYILRNFGLRFVNTEDVQPLPRWVERDRHGSTLFCQS